MKWPMVKLADVCQVNPRLPKEYDETQDVSFLAMASVSEDGILLNQETRVLSETKKGFTYFERGDVIVAKITPCFENGKAAYLDSLQTQVGFGSTEFHVLRPNIKQLDGKYLFYLIWNRKFRFIAERIMSGSAGQKRVPASFLQNFEIPLPPLAEQKRIAAIMDKADAIRQKRQQAITLADQFLRSVFLDMFGDPVTNPKGWDEVVLKDIADIRSGVTKGKIVKEDDAITLPYMRVANVQDGYLDLSSIQEITVSKKDANKSTLQIGDILLTEGGDPDKLGRGHVWNGEIENCIHQNHIFSVRVIDSNYVRPSFLSSVISSSRGKKYFLKVGKQTTGIATINKTVLSEFLPFIPPLEMQDKYLGIMKKVKEIPIYSECNYMKLFSSLSQKAFSGQL
ncbi:TPA: restriction endonuclease subunit S [Aeromonas veronii]|uniref:restriction endonuclease subunit S n=1 Tax=Aeromonas veronii TaxID=654 RepID=UPI0022466A63|nr:restriction endonuclease subunit S [Aeromonas veronii]EKP0294303.1 restriction endonuclease subunit S [Aeromonas veronii]MCX0438919.1 restriction endonuclease subunit S [Aeromonas veronii]